MAAYYNEIDPFDAGWLRKMIAAGVIVPGDVDERDIKEVQPYDLNGYSQCHFFAGIGVWSYALRAAGWPDDSPVWTGSCPCQSFSASGQRGGFSDQRHLWPAWFRLIGECRPHPVFGEQVASGDGLAWFDLVSADLEGAGYAVGAADTCAAGFGAPHIRQRLYFVADAGRSENYQPGYAGQAEQGGDGQNHGLPGGSCEELRTAGRMADSESARRRPPAEGWKHDGNGHDTGRKEATSGLAVGSEADDVADAERSGLGGWRAGEKGREPGAVERPKRLCATGDLGHAASFGRAGRIEAAHRESREQRRESDSITRAGLLNGFWRNAEWLWCRDGKYRPVEPGTFPLVTGATNRVGRLRGYGNALCAPQAEAFIRAYREAVNSA